MSGGTLDGLASGTEYHLWAAVYDGRRWRGWGPNTVMTTRRADEEAGCAPALGGGGGGGGGGGDVERSGVPRASSQEHEDGSAWVCPCDLTTAIVMQELTAPNVYCV